MPLVDGIYQYDDTEEMSPLKDYVNLLGDSVRTVLTTPGALGALLSWTALAADANWGNDALNPPAVSGPDHLGVVRGRGRITRPGATFTGVPGVIRAVPAASRPAKDRVLIVPTSNGPAIATLTTAGSLAITTSYTWTQNVSWINLDGVSWEIS